MFRSIFTELFPLNPLAHLGVARQKRNHASRFGSEFRRGQAGNKAAHGSLKSPTCILYGPSAFTVIGSALTQ
jgi:hypothetical protein